MPLVESDLSADGKPVAKATSKFLAIIYEFFSGLAKKADKDGKA